MDAVQFIQTTPEKLQNAILTGMQEQLKELTKQFQPKEPTEYLTLHNWTKRGKLKAYGIGARVYYKRHEVEAGLIPLNS